MKQRQFSDQQLFALRNHIPIGLVIEKILCLPSKINHGVFRFQCPLCDEFNTAINPPANLARCFHCETNFNPIDMVMAVKNTSFVEAATLLKNYQTNSSHDKKQNPEKEHRPPATDPILQRPDEMPVALANILSNIMEKKMPIALQPNKTDSSPQNTTLAYRIAKLEQNFQRLSEQMDQLISIILKQK